MKSKLARLSALGTGLLVSASVFAQEATDPFSTAVTEVTGKISTYGAALVGLSAAGVVFMIAIKYVKKIRGAA